MKFRLRFEITNRFRFETFCTAQFRVFFFLVLGEFSNRICVFRIKLFFDAEAIACAVSETGQANSFSHEIEMHLDSLEPGKLVKNSTE